MVLFKYVGEFGPEILRKCQIKVSKTTDFNDPFEVSPAIDLSLIAAANIRELMQNEQNIIQAYKQGNQSKTYFDFKNEYLNFIESEINNISQNSEKFKDSIRNNFNDEFNRNFRILCLSESNASILMWSHYSNCHKGMVIGFDMTKSIFGKMNNHSYIYNVNYPVDEKRPSLTFKSKQKELIQKIIEISITKSPHWEYEKEKRILFPLSFRHIENGHDFIRFDYQCIHSIYFGCRAENSYVKEAVNHLNSNGCKHVKIFQCEQSRDEYKLLFQPLTKN